jgi:hypothetical protein
MCTIAAAAVEQTPTASALAHLHGNDTGAAAAPNNLNIDIAVADEAVVQQAHLSGDDTDTALPNNVNIDTAAAAAAASAAAAQQADLSDNNADAALLNNVNIDTAVAAASAQADISSSDTDQVVMNSVNIDSSALAAAADTAAAAATATTAAAETGAASFAAVANDTASSSTDSAVAVSSCSPSAAATSELLWGALRVLHEHESLPLDIACVCKAALALITTGRLIKVQIRAGMSAATMQSLLSRSNIKHVHIDGTDVSADVIAVIAAALPDYERYTHTFRVVTALWPQSMTVISIENFEQWDYRTVLTLIETLPASVTILTVAAQPPQAFEAHRHSMMCPSSVQTLTLRNIWWGVFHNADGVKGWPLSQLKTVHYEGQGSWISGLPRGLKVLDMSQVANRYCLSGILSYSTLTHLRLPESARLCLSGSVVVLPRFLRVLDTGYKFNQPLSKLRDTLRELYIKRRADDTLQYDHNLGQLPFGLAILQVANATHSLGVLPSKLEVLHCRSHMHALGILPDSLKVLKIDGSNFNHPLGLLPDGLVELDLSTAVDFEQPLGVLPQSLKIIRMHSNYKLHADVPQRVLVLVAAAAVTVAAPLHAAAAAAIIAAPAAAPAQQQPQQQQQQQLQQQQQQQQ